VATCEPPLAAVHHPLSVYAIVVAAVEVIVVGDTVPPFGANVTV
jgi:hypothetical protein